MPLYTPAVDELARLKAPESLIPSVPGQLSETTAARPAADSFSNLQGRMVAEVNDPQHAATDAVGALQSGQNVPLHQVVIAMEEANLSFQLMVEVRNKLLDAYQEIMRMQV